MIHARIVEGYRFIEMGDPAPTQINLGNPGETLAVPWVRVVNPATKGIEAILPTAQEPTCNLLLSDVGSLSATVQCSESYRQYFNEGNLIQIVHGDGGAAEATASGVIHSYSFPSENKARINAYSEEHLFLRGYHLSPVDYSPVYNSLSLTDALNNTLLGWRTLKATTQANFELAGRATERVNINTTLYQDSVILDYNGDTFYATGHIALSFQRSEIDKFNKWERIRWVGSYTKDYVETTMQYRWSTGPSTYSAWSSPVTSWDKSTKGIEIDPLGIAADEIQVKINLTTFDTTTSDGGTPPNFGVSPFLSVVEVVARTDSYVTLGSIESVADTVFVNAIDANEKSQLDIIKALCQQKDFEFKVKNQQLFVEKELGQDLSNTYSLTV